MSDAAVVIAYGPNDVEVPVLFFPNATAAHEYLRKAGFSRGAANEWYDLFENKDMGAAFKDRARDDDGEEILSPAESAIFKGKYYGGCGEIDLLIVQEINFATPFVNWDLD